MGRNVPFQQKWKNKQPSQITKIKKSKLSKKAWLAQENNRNTFFSKRDLFASSVKRGTRPGYLAAGKRFYAYIDSIRDQAPTFPSLQDLLDSFNLPQLDILVGDYLTYKFNKTLNTGGTLNNEACGILYSISVDYGIVLTTSLLPSIKRICKGADNILLEMFGPRVKGKYPILNPILEDMLLRATPWEQWALLLASRFCLRSQHYCNNKRNKRPTNASDSEDDEGIKSFVQVGDLRFNPSIVDPKSLTIITKRDKNNPDLHHMERTVECTCNTPWTCVVHLGQKLFQNNTLPLSAAACQCRTGDMHYSAMRCIVRSLIKKIGLDPRHYGTHSLRSGGTSELFIEGRSAIFIKNFVWWKNLSSIFIYIRPNNPDLLHYAPSFVAYRQQRLRQTGLTDFIDQHWKNVWQDMDKEIKKQKRGRRTIVKRRTFNFNRVQVVSPSQRVTRPARREKLNPHMRPQGQQVFQQRGQSRQQNRRQFRPKHVYTDYARLGYHLSKGRVPFVQTTVGMRQNPFRHV